jgi:hypothetical protein
MTPRTPLLFTLLSVILAFPALGQSAETTQKLLDKEGATIKALASDPTLVAATKAQNAKRVDLAAIQAIDEQWIAGKVPERVQQTTTGPCADRLRELVAAHAAYGETFVTDDQGALVCATLKTTDYWQGDEPKWQRAFAEGKGAVFIDRPRFDDSASIHLAQISVPIVDRGKVIGVLTVGVVVEKLPR